MWRAVIVIGLSGKVQEVHPTNPRNLPYPVSWLEAGPVDAPIMPAGNR